MHTWRTIRWRAALTDRVLISGLYAHRGKRSFVCSKLRHMSFDENDTKHRCSILPRSPEVLASGTFQIPILKTVVDASSTPLVLLLVTPSLLGLLEKNNPFISNALWQAFERLPDGQEVDVLAAVVDRISYPPSSYITRAGSGYPSLIYGFEGLSMLVGRSRTIAPDLWSFRDETYERETMTVEQRCCLSFLIQDQEPSRSPLDWLPAVSYSIELPLANTLFQNGKTSTMFAQRWTVTSGSGSEPELSCIKEKTIQQQDVQLPIRGYFDKISTTTKNLIALTPPQIVNAAMGNIIRKVQVAHDPEEVEPASNKLEEAISSYNATPLLPPILQIWAQVIPREIWSAQPSVRRHPLNNINQGHRLHRVLSGGGGWGNKQGLLSLDPDSKFRRNSKTSNNVFGDRLDLETGESELLGEVVKPGDTVQFWGVQRPEIPPSESLSASGENAPITLRSREGLRFGSLLSTMDERPAEDASKINVTNQLNTLIFRGHFGALSETGISLKIETHGLEDSCGARKLGKVVQTKLPPLSSLMVKRYNEDTNGIDEPISQPVPISADTKETKLQRKTTLPKGKQQKKSFDDGTAPGGEHNSSQSSKVSSGQGSQDNTETKLLILKIPSLRHGDEKP